MTPRPSQQMPLPLFRDAAPQRLDMLDAEVWFHPEFLRGSEADEFLKALMKEPIPWKQDNIVLYDRVIPVPRLASWHGDPGLSYTYSGIRSEPEPWTPMLLAIKPRVDALAGIVFNSVLANQYRDGSDSVAWHSDDEPELGEDPVIASVSFGETRTFQLRHKRDKSLRLQLELPHGSCLLMRGATQHHWLHQIPKTRRPCGPRINLTYRVIRRTV